MKSIASRLSLIESKRRLTMMPLVLFYRASEGLSREQQSRIDAAKQSGRSVRIIRTFVADDSV